MLRVLCRGCHFCECHLYLLCHRLRNAESRSSSVSRRQSLNGGVVVGFVLRRRIGVEACCPQVLLLLEFRNGMELASQLNPITFLGSNSFFLGEQPCLHIGKNSGNSMEELCYFSCVSCVTLDYCSILHVFCKGQSGVMRWKVRFDFILVLFSIIENILVFDLFGTSVESGGSGVNLGFLRLLRLCKIVKILRVFRTLRFFSELRLMLDCVVGSLMNVFWCLIMLIFVMYVFALLLQQGVVQYLQERTSDWNESSQIGLQTYFSSVGVTVVTLFQSCTSGVDWSEPYKALQPTGWVLPIAFLLYIAFAPGWYFPIRCMYFNICLFFICLNIIWYLYIFCLLFMATFRTFPPPVTDECPWFETTNKVFISVWNIVTSSFLALLSISFTTSGSLLQYIRYWSFLLRGWHCEGEFRCEMLILKPVTNDQALSRRLWNWHSLMWICSSWNSSFKTLACFESEMLTLCGCIFKTNFPSKIDCPLLKIRIFLYRIFLIYVFFFQRLVQDFEDCRMLAKLFKRMLKTDAEGHERLGLDEFRKLVETYEFRSYLQTRGMMGMAAFYDRFIRVNWGRGWKFKGESTSSTKNWP